MRSSPAAMCAAPRSQGHVEQLISKLDDRNLRAQSPGLPRSRARSLSTAPKSSVSRACHS
jgi:hypothetical protein